jgi:hypothetical protein
MVVRPFIPLQILEHLKHWELGVLQRLKFLSSVVAVVVDKTVVAVEGQVHTIEMMPFQYHIQHHS